MTTKHVVVGLSYNLRTRAVQLGARLSILCPGVIRTPSIEGGWPGPQVAGRVGGYRLGFEAADSVVDTNCRVCS